MQKISSMFKGILWLVLGSLTQVFSNVEVVQTRLVPPDNIDEFVERETTYWSEVARKAIKDGKMVGWSLWQRLDGLNVDESHNFMFINSYAETTDLDHTDEIWNFKKVFPNKKLEDVDTFGLSTVKDVLFYDRIAFSSKAQPKFIRINYAKAADVQDYLDLELIEWFPFVQERMDSGKTNVVSWELSRLVAPRGRDIPHGAISIDGFDTLSAALFTYYGTDVPFPDIEALQKVHYKAEVHVYKLIKAVGQE
ncbi:MAG: hypothetical protein O7C75_18100 [Verrucomicrobia bacterium]|nr:hypothetical protein [Verrucomicrobiota bacterium]